MYKTKTSQQISIFDFNQSCGMKLDMENEWIRAAERMPWQRFESRYADAFESDKGAVAFPFRMALGALLIRERLGLTGRQLTQRIAGDPYLQYFIGLPAYSEKEPFQQSSLFRFRKRIGTETLCQINDTLVDMFLSDVGNAADCVLLNEAREILEKMIQFQYKSGTFAKRPKTFRRTAAREYREFAAEKDRDGQRTRELKEKLLNYIENDLTVLAECRNFPENEREMLQKVREVYDQQKALFDKPGMKIKKRIETLSDSYTIPVQQGKAGDAYIISTERNGLTRMQQCEYYPLDETTAFQIAVEKRKGQGCKYPSKVSVDTVFRNKENRKYLKMHGIRLSRKSPDKKYDAEELLFGEAENVQGMAIIRTDIDTDAVALKILSDNLFGKRRESSNLIFLSEGEEENVLQACFF